MYRLLCFSCPKLSIGFVAHILPSSPSLHSYPPSPLRFACRAKSIKNKPVVNEILSEAALLKRYAKEIKALQNILATERNSDKAQEVEQVSIRGAAVPLLCLNFR